MHFGSVFVWHQRHLFVEEPFYGEHHKQENQRLSMPIIITYTNTTPMRVRGKALCGEHHEWDQV